MAYTEKQCALPASRENASVAGWLSEKVLEPARLGLAVDRGRWEEVADLGASTMHASVAKKAILAAIGHARYETALNIGDRTKLNEARDFASERLSGRFRQAVEDKDAETILSVGTVSDKFGFHAVDYFSGKRGFSPGKLAYLGEYAKHKTRDYALNSIIALLNQAEGEKRGQLVEALTAIAHYAPDDTAKRAIDLAARTGMRGVVKTAERSGKTEAIKQHAGKALRGMDSRAPG
ncbi:MAG: hypothetical protein PHF51_01785 [Candidatus ainarchaeum sp.]|nr:hypothetical protein [Candidatus ainarchaeum sp.]